jgi:methylmalonyl-CoA mutase
VGKGDKDVKKELKKTSRCVLDFSEKKIDVKILKSKHKHIIKNLIKIELKFLSMPDHAIHAVLKDSFPKSNKENWSVAASKEIQGKDPFEALAWRTKDQINFFPYYDQHVSKEIVNLNFQIPPSSAPHKGPRAWQNLPLVSVIDIHKANDLAISHLENGADGILFDLRKFNVVDINRLLDKIDWAYCSVSFLVTPSIKIGDHIIEFIREKKFDEALLEGMLIWETVPHDAHTVIHTLPGFDKFQTLGIHINPSSPVNEISDALQKVVTLMDLLTDKNVRKEIAWRNISVSLPVGVDFFLEISKLIALRFLLFQVAKAFEIHDYGYSDFQIHTRSNDLELEKFQPHSNLLKSTNAAIAAIMGGCNSLTVMAGDQDNVMLNRVARNVSTILREEAHMDKVSDPVAGSYAIENIVYKIAEAAWLDFQRNLKIS